MGRDHRIHEWLYETSFKDRVSDEKLGVIGMKCQRCGKCCEDTRMELSAKDIRRLEKAGYLKEDFAQHDSEGIWRLRNSEGICSFLDPSSRECGVYELRPVGCSIYPINLGPEGVVVVDEACPAGRTIDGGERKKKGVLLRHQLRVIDADRKR